jgi:hypothetical protein
MLTSLSLPEGLKYIGKNAFAGNRISGLNVPAGVYIGENAFADNQIRELVIGKDVAWAKGAFANNGMTSLTVEQTNRVAVENAFAGNALTSLTLPENFVGAQKNFPMELMKYYYSSAQEAGTYSLQNGKCFHNGKEMSEPAAITVDPGVSIRISSKSSGGYYYGFSIEGVGLMYYLAPGTYSVAASYDKIDGNMRTTSERHVTLDNQNFGSGKTYRVKAALNRIYEQVSYSIDELQ